MANIRRLVVETIEHKDQRYDTSGDWIYDPQTETVTVYVSDLGDWRMNMACGLHELIETMLCVRDGVPEEKVSAFDIAYEAARQAGAAAPCGCIPSGDSEPGEDRHAPYRTQHAFADGIERLFCNAIGVVWSGYNDAVYGLDWYEDRDQPDVW